MKKTIMSQNYKYYVYVCPGVIEYFNELEEAQDCADRNDSEVQEMDT